LLWGFGVGVGVGLGVGGGGGVGDGGGGGWEPNPIGLTRVYWAYCCARERACRAGARPPACACSIG
jgi:hypothetical protein